MGSDLVALCTAALLAMAFFAAQLRRVDAVEPQLFAVGPSPIAEVYVNGDGVAIVHAAYDGAVDVLRFGGGHAVLRWRRLLGVPNKRNGSFRETIGGNAQAPCCLARP